MISSRLRPKVVIWWGVGLSVGGSLLVLLVPGFVAALVGGASGVSQDVQVPTELILRVAASVLPSLGAAFIGAGLVMLYIEKQILTARGNRAATSAAGMRILPED
jgi:hypothetical protein